MESSLDELLVYEDLAFSTPQPSGSSVEFSCDKDDLIKAIARAPFEFQDKRGYSTRLNVELFGDPSWSRILLFVHGVCESAESWTVQNLARICASRNWRMAVLELEGHGLSQGSRGVIGKSWDRSIEQVKEFCMHTLCIDRLQKQALSGENCNQKYQDSRFVLAGASLGGALAAYASASLLKETKWNSSFIGTLLICPAVGVDHAVVPPPFIVTCLSALAFFTPSMGIEGATPTEDPSHYNCPPWTNRNFSGPWPLGTSKLLLDITSKRVPSDVESGKLNLLQPRATTETTLRHKIWVISGDKDPVVPIQTVRKFIDGMKAQQETKDIASTSAETTIEILEIKKGDHGLLAQSVDGPHVSKTQKRTTQMTMDHVNAFLQLCEEEMGASHS